MNRFTTIAPLLILLLCLSLFGTVPKPASGQAPEPSIMPLVSGDRAGVWSESESVIYLPLVDRNHFPRPICSSDSPFSIQFAALSHNTGTVGAAIEGGMSRVEWRAWVDDVFPDLVQALKESGACWARLRLDWDLYELDPAWFDDKLRLIAGTGVRMIAVIDDVPEWARGEPYPAYACTHVAEDPTPPDEFALFLTGLVNRYKELPWNIHVWEFRNEPDGIDPVELDPVGQGCGGERADLYVENLQRAFQAIKAADPTATVLMGGLAYDRFTEYGGPYNRYFPDDVMANGGAEYMDALNMHYYPDFHAEWERWVWYPGHPQAGPATCGDVEDGQGAPYEAWGVDLIAKVKHLRNRMDTCFGVQRPVWVTEVGEHGYPDVPGSLEQQARYVIQGQVRGLAAGAVNITWFALVAPSNDPFQHGLLFDDLSPKPAYHTYQTLVRELSGYDYSHTLDVEDVEAYVFFSALGTEKTVAWATGEPGEPATLTFASSGPLRIVDREGNVSHVHDGGPGDGDGSQNGSIQLQLPAVPVDPDPDNPPRLTAEPLIVSR